MGTIRFSMIPFPISNPRNYGTTRRTGPTPKIDDRTKRQIKRLALKKTIYPAKIKTEWNIKATMGRIQQILQEY